MVQVTLAVGIIATLALAGYTTETRLLMPRPRGVLPAAEIESQQLNLFAYAAAFNEVAFIVNKNNPRSDITREEIIDIFTGNIRTWKKGELKGDPIWIVNKVDENAAFEISKQYFATTGKFLKDAVLLGRDKQAIESVAAIAHAIGYVTLGAAITAEAEGLNIKRLILDGREGPVITARKQIPKP